MMTLRTDYKARWSNNTRISSFDELMGNRTCIGVMLGDELLWQKLSVSELTMAAELVKRDFPNAIVYWNEA